jgi:hypothetical protein
MRKTYVEAKFKFVDNTAIADATLDTESNQPYGNLALFSEEGSVEVTDYATLEHNLFILDGSKTIPGEDVTDVAYMSDIMSLSDCTFEENPVLSVQFSVNHSSCGLTLTFGIDYPTKIKVTWYTVGGAKLQSSYYTPDSLNYFCYGKVSNYGKVDIEFIETRLPYQYARLQYIDYGIITAWDKSNVTSASVQEEIDITSKTLSINTAKVSVIDANRDFDIANSDGLWKYVQKSQEININEYINDNPVNIGTYFISEKSYSGNIASFTLTDRIGLMDNYTFYDGDVYARVKAGELLDAIFAAAGVTKYSIDDDLYDIPLTGTLEIQSCRSALQMVCFTIGAVADDSRSDYVKVHTPGRYTNYTVPISRKFEGNTSASLEDYVSGVSVEYNKYTLKSETDEIYSGTLSQGRTRIELSSPCDTSTLTITGGTIAESKPYYILVDMSSDGECTINGKSYESTTFTISKSVDILDANKSVNVKSFTGITLHNAYTLDHKLDSLLSYYKLRNAMKMKFILENEHVGVWVDVKGKTGDDTIALIEKQSLDLTGGFISTAECLGYSAVNTYRLFTGNELYAGEEGVI